MLKNISSKRSFLSKSRQNLTDKERKNKIMYIFVNFLQKSTAKKSKMSKFRYVFKDIALYLISISQIENFVIKYLA